MHYETMIPSSNSSESSIASADAEVVARLVDPDNGGLFSITDFCQSIVRLRGVPRRGDIICIDLMLRSVQHDITELKACMQMTLASVQKEIMECKGELRDIYAVPMPAKIFANSSGKEELCDISDAEI